MLKTSQSVLMEYESANQGKFLFALNQLFLIFIVSKVHIEIHVIEHLVTKFLTIKLFISIYLRK